MSREGHWQLLESITERLDDAGVPSPDVDARLLLDAMEDRFGSLAGCPSGVLDALVERRAAREPLQVLLGRTTFRWVDLEVTRGVFVPRPETEVVAGLAIDAANGVVARGERPVVAEPCTGTGAITCALLTEVPGVRVLATDVSAEAVDLARRNVAATLDGTNAAAGRQPQDGADAEVLPGHLLDPLGQLGPWVYGGLDVLVSNPPYLPAGDLPTMAPEVADHDPHAALFGGDDGHEVVHDLLDLAVGWLRPGGTVVLEIDDRRGDEVARRAAAAGLVDVRVEQDLTGRDRAVTAHRRD